MHSEHIVNMYQIDVFTIAHLGDLIHSQPGGGEIRPLLPPPPPTSQ